MSDPGATVGVIGGGTMGAGIAHACVVTGHPVVLVERDEQAAAAARERVASMVEAGRRRGRLTEDPERVMDRLRVSLRMAQLSDAVLVIESVFEDVALKASVLAELEAAVGPEVQLASNTSSIAIGELAAALERPDRFVGLHFFNPVPASRLVEVIVGPASAAETVAHAQEWVIALGKQAIVVADAPGFASSRLGIALGLEAVRMLEEGVASAADIDRAMELGYRHPMGPLALGDLVGLDVRLGIADYLADRLGERFQAPELLRRKVRDGELGRKSGVGFYDYRPGAAGS